VDHFILASLFTFNLWFAYYNIVAFIKRSVSFSILLNTSLPKSKRKKESYFFHLDKRIDEMINRGWIEEEKKIMPTKKGRILGKIYLFVSELLSIRRIG
jgi:hypothetical protein